MGPHQQSLLQEQLALVNSLDASIQRVNQEIERRLQPHADIVERLDEIPGCRRALLVRFIGTCEVAGALGMLLPGLLRIRPSLTPFAATGLVVLMIFATVLTLIMISPDPVMTLIPATVGAMAAFVALPDCVWRHSAAAGDRNCVQATTRHQRSALA